MRRITTRFCGLLALAWVGCGVEPGVESLSDDEQQGASQEVRLNQVIRTTPPGEPIVQVEQTTGVITVSVYIDPAYVRSQPGLHDFQMNGAFDLRVPLRDPSTGEVRWGTRGQMSEPVARPRHGLLKFRASLTNNGCEGRSCFDPLLDVALIARLGVAVGYHNTLGDFWLQKKGENHRPAPVDCTRASISAARRSGSPLVDLAVSAQCMSSARRMVYADCSGGNVLLPTVREEEVVQNPRATERLTWDPARAGLRRGDSCTFIVTYTSTRDYSDRVTGSPRVEL